MIVLVPNTQYYRIVSNIISTGSDGCVRIYYNDLDLEGGPTALLVLHAKLTIDVTLKVAQSQIRTYTLRVISIETTKGQQFAGGV